MTIIYSLAIICNRRATRATKQKKGRRFLRLVDTYKHSKATEKAFSWSSLCTSYWLSKPFSYLNNLRSQLVRISKAPLSSGHRGQFILAGAKTEAQCRGWWYLTCPPHKVPWWPWWKFYSECRAMTEESPHLVSRLYYYSLEVMCDWKTKFGHSAKWSLFSHNAITKGL